MEVVSAGATDLGIYSFNDGTGGKLQLDENGNSRELEITPGNSGVRLGHAGKKGEWITRRLELKDADAIAADNTAYDVYQAQDAIRASGSGSHPIARRMFTSRRPITSAAPCNRRRKMAGRCRAINRSL